MSSARRSSRRIAVAVCGLALAWVQAAGAADRVNLMTTYRQGSIQPWQVRPGVTGPVFGNAADAGSRPGLGTANGDVYTLSFAANPNVQVVHDGNLSGTVTNDRFIVENVRFNLLNGSTRELVAVTLTVDNGAGSVASETREIDVVDPLDPISDTPLENLAIEVNIAIQDGLRALYLDQQADGRWRQSTGPFNPHDCAVTGFTIWAFANSGHQPTNDPDTDIYAEFVQRGVEFILSQASVQTPVNQPNIGNPDGDGNGRMISLCGANGAAAVGYATPIAAAGVIASYSSAPATLVTAGPLAGQSYAQVIRDTIDWIAFGQHDGAGEMRGGWRYNPNGGADTSSDSWSYVAQEGFEAVFGGSVLELVKQEAERRIDSSQAEGAIGDRGQFGYTGTGPLGFDGNATTAGGLSGLVMVTRGGRVPPLLNGALASPTFPDAESRKAAAVAHLGLRWDAAGGVWAGNRNNFYAMWTTARALRLNGTELLVASNGVVFDWETGENQATPGVLPPANSIHEGYFPFLVRTQAADGAWNATVNGGNWTRSLNTAWGVLVLQPTVFGPPPIANFPPVALCQDPVLFTDFGACTAGAGVDAGSFDPEGGDLTYLQEPPGPYSPVETAVTLTVEDPDGQTASCEATVTVTDPEPPQISCNAPALISGVAGASYSFTSTATDNCEPGSAVTIEVTTATCEDDDGDDDGVPDDQDECADSDTSEEVVIAECVTGVFNVLFPTGCTITDLILACGTEVENHGEFVSCVAHLTNELNAQGIITGEEKGRIMTCAAQAPIPPGHPGGGSLSQPLEVGGNCTVTADGATVTFPDGPNSGRLEWTVSATDGAGNVTTETCSVVIQDPDTPLPNLPPVADAGGDQIVPGGATVALDGSGSTDIDGDPVTYQWTLTEAPAGSAAALSDPTSPTPSFVADRPGFYTAELVVHDGLAASAPDAVRVRALNGRPLASAGADREVFGGETVALDGTGSVDPEGALLTYSWTLVFKPADSEAALDDPTSATPSFEADLRGTYVVQLVVGDGELTSLVDAVIVRAVNRAPVADAGDDQEISVFDTVQLDGTGSFDGDGDPLTYLWSFASRPAGSTAFLSAGNSATPTFVADVAGTYVLELVVSDGFTDSAPDAVSIVTVNTPPVANAGPDQTVFLGTTVQLNGTGSFDVDGDPITYQWTIINRPAGSTAALSDPTSPQPTFVVDRRGTFGIQLVVHDGQRPSRQPDVVQVTVPNRVPVANAGPDQTVFLGATVQLDGRASSDADGDPLTFAWSFLSRPTGSTAVLVNPTSPLPTFVADRRGTYIVRLIVNDGFTSSPADSVTITVPNRAPVANAGPDQNAFVTATVFLDGSASFDADGDPLTYAWTFQSRPAGSTAALVNPTAVNPTFVVDRPGTYVVRLIVNDGFVSSPPDTVTIVTLNSPPVANAGPDQEVLPGETVQLDGSGSFDVDGDALTYFWSFLAVPAGSTAVLSDPTAVNPTFVLDVVGAYLVQLVVNDGLVDSAPDTVSIATGNVAPVADAGPDQTAFVGDTVQLDGSGSFDANGDPITYAWSFVSRPAGSTAVLSNPTAVNPTFEIDVFGDYVVRLIVNDGEFDSAPDTVTITTENSRPVAVAGADQVVLTGSTVFLDGSGSFDVDGDLLTYSWSLIAVPVGSTAQLSDPTAVDPTFVADVVGVYVAQLIVNDGELDSVPDTVMITASDDVAIVPDVVGLDQAVAEAAIVAAGLVVGDVTLVPSGVVPAGEVIDQDPDGGTTVLAGSAVDLVVSAGLDPDLLAEILVLPQADRILVGGGLQLQAIAIFGDGTSTDVTSTAFWASSAPAVAQVNATGFVIGAGAGVATITAEFDGVVGSALVAVEPRVNDGVPPTAEIASPADNASITSPVDVIGTATDANFLKYELAISPAGDGTFTTIATGTSPVMSGVLGTFDPTLLLNGPYDVLLRVFDRSGFITSDLVVYHSEGDQKVGNFSLTFTDLDVPVAGIPITVNRTYDSRDKQRGDFGFGWRLSVKTLSVSDNGLQGANWSVSRTGTIIPTFFLNASRAHRVSVTLPDGEVEVFDFTPQPSSSVLVPFQFVSPAYTARPGTLGTLSVPFADLLVNGAQPGPVDIIDLDTLEHYDPQLFFYTDAQGQRFTVHKTNGVSSVTDRNGNTLTINAGGIFHSSGTSVVFARDGQGRITSMTDPNGNVQGYEYDADGDLAAHTDGEGNRTTYRYNFTHGLLQILDARGLTPTRYEYDDDGRLVAMVDPNGNRVEYDADLVGRQQVVTDRRGNATVYLYDEDGNVTSVTDALGNTKSYDYDARGNELSVTDALGNTSTRTYDARNNILTETDPLGNTVTRTYNSRNQLLTQSDDLGNTITHTYDAAGNLLTLTDAEGNTTTHTYDARGNRLTTTDGEGNVLTYQYDALGRRTRSLDAAGGETTYTYDANGNMLTETTTRTVAGGGTVSMTTTRVYDGNDRIVQEIDPLGNVSFTEYTANGKEAARVDKNGNRTEYEYDARGNLVRTVFPDGTEEVAAYDPEGNRTSWTDRGGRTTLYEYDALNRLVRTVYPDGSDERRQYDDAGREIARIDGNGNVTAYEYDDAGRRTKVVDALGNETQLGYDAAGNRTSQTDALGRVTTFEYDGDNRLTRTIFPDGSTTVVAYDAEGRKLAETDQAGNTTSFEYDGLGKLTKVTDALGGETLYAYDEAGNQLSTTDANGHTTSWSYDHLGRVTSRTLPLGMSETATYDGNGNQLTRTDFNGATTQYTYDVNNRLVRTLYPGGSDVRWTYTATGQIATIADGRGTTRQTWDLRDRLTEVEHPNGDEISYTYDDAGNRTSVTTPVGTTSYDYDALNRLVEVISPEGLVTTYGYDDVGNRTLLLYANGTRAEYVYNSLSRLTQLTNENAVGGVISSYSYVLGPAGNRLRVTESSGRIVDYSYDVLYRLTEERISEPGGGVTTVSYGYDAVGNRLTETENGVTTNYTYDINDRLLSRDATAYAYDDNGNRTSETGPSAVIDYQYDFENRLVQAANASATPAVVQYVYDAGGERVRKVAGVVVTDYLVDTNLIHSQVLVETDGTGLVRASYVHGDDLVSMSRGGALSFYHYDGQMSTRQLSDLAGTVTDTYAYDAFGELLSSTGTTPNDYLYTGEQYDPNIGFYYLRARYYAPVEGRFLTMDTVMGDIFEPVTLHKYLYVSADPINNIDPSGHMFVSVAITIPMRPISISLPSLARVLLLARQAAILLTGAAVRACAITAALSTFTAAFSNSPCDITNFNIFYAGIDTPKTTDHIRDAIASGQQAVLTRKSPPHPRTWIHIGTVCTGNQPAQSGLWCDEYPFASTEQGGPGASLRLVPAWEQMVQGGKLGGFYGACKVVANDKIEGLFGVVPIWGPSFWVCK